MNTTGKQGSRCYYETVRDGLVPGRAEAVYTDPLGVRVKIRVTRDNGAYKAGEYVVTSHLHAIPSGAVRRTTYSTRILPYVWVVDAP